MNLISADANNNPRNLMKKITGNPVGEMSGMNINRNDLTRDSLQSRLIERIHNKKI